jgi:hypothetical protein
MRDILPGQCIWVDWREELDGMAIAKNWIVKFEGGHWKVMGARSPTERLPYMEIQLMFLFSILPEPRYFDGAVTGNWTGRTTCFCT